MKANGLRAAGSAMLDRRDASSHRVLTDRRDQNRSHVSDRRDSYDRREYYATALAAPPLTPEHAPVRTFDGGGGRSFNLRVPPDDAAIHALVKQAHATVAGAADYDSSMRAEVARLIRENPVFWARVWPAGLALSRFLLANAGLCARRSVLELGAGLGMGAVCATSDVIGLPLTLSRRTSNRRGSSTAWRARATMAWARACARWRGTGTRRCPPGSAARSTCCSPVTSSTKTRMRRG
jgi:hypothetical protein